MSRFTLFFLFLTCCSIHTNAQLKNKINGISFVAGSNVVTAEEMHAVHEIESNFLALMPFAYGTMGKPKLSYHNLDWQHWGESLEGVKETALLAKERNIQCMIKPQIWFDWGSFTGHFELESESDWVAFESGYTDYIMSFALLSEELQLPIFCLGTELCNFVDQRPEYWIKLISDVRQVYSGQLTYAANWDSFKNIQFWDQLDFIGIDAYFPLCDQQTPSVKECQKAWQNHTKSIRSVSKNFDRQILFTEWGFRSADYCAREPWDYNKDFAVNAQAQANCISATFNHFWLEDWFAGGFIWKWFPNHKASGGSSNNRFTPQNKPAQEIIKEWFNATKDAE